MTIYNINSNLNPENFCVYLTIYSGNKMPMFYIGRVKIEKILFKNYNGSVSSEDYRVLWLEERKNNPNLFKTIIIKTFITDKESSDYEAYLHNKFDVAKNVMFINKHNHTGKFCKNGKMSDEHKKRISASNKGKVRSEKTKILLSEQRKGRIPWNKGIKNAYNNDLKKKISETLKNKKLKWYNDGIKEYLTSNPEPFWIKGRINLPPCGVYYPRKSKS